MRNLEFLSDHEPVKGACVEEATLEDAFLKLLWREGW